ncbi:hypothetical protein E2C01_040828 [Portunus trituberculatus]|uniref:Uncharacterized protein n=1 Tax=Portunus trituberculatus TaxID=210409 RepID=A0A5B7FPT8_PORTR|nr:hypothetical protein [Portunus trituberculatus]
MEIQKQTGGFAMVQWNHACFGVRGTSKRTGSNPVHGPSVDLSSSTCMNHFPSRVSFMLHSMRAESGTCREGQGEWPSLV